jgi:hypothetical protein
MLRDEPRKFSFFNERILVRHRQVAACWLTKSGGGRERTTDRHDDAAISTPVISVQSGKASHAAMSAILRLRKAALVGMRINEDSCRHDLEREANFL